MAKHPIPDKALAQHIVILGKTGSGKTYAAKGAVENILSKKGRVCIIDPTGAWHGLRSSASGKRAGFPVVIFGGEHADLPLGSAHGEAVAEIVGTSSTPTIIDTSLLRVGERTRFFADFAEALLRKNKGPLNLIVDEAHLFAPQGKVNDPQSGAMLNAANNLVSLGRSRGLRIMLITQRPAKLHKDSLTQVETMVALRLIAPQDRKAVREWIADNADEEQGQEIISSLAKLPTGQGWIWAPEIDVLERVKFPEIKTFNTSKAPSHSKRGKGPVLAPINREAIEQKLQTVAADALANDPKTLKTEIAALKKQLASVKIPKSNGVDPDKLRQAEAAAFERGRASGYAEGVTVMTKQLDPLFKSMNEAMSIATRFERTADFIKTAKRPVKIISTPESRAMLAKVKAAPPSKAANRLVKLVNSGRAPKAAAPAPDGLTSPQKRILQSLAFWASIGRDDPTREQVAAVAGYKPGSGNFNNIIGGLGTLGHTSVPSPGRLSLVADYPGFTPEEAKAKLLDVLDNPQKRLVTAALAESADLTRDDLATNSGYVPGSGNFNNITGKLTTMNILERTGAGRIAISDWAREVLQ